jgi:hypothetical protein
MQTLAVTMGNQWRKLGFNALGVNNMVSYVATLDEAELQEHIEAGETMLIPLPGYELWLPNRNIDARGTDKATREKRTMAINADIGLAYDRVKDHCERLALQEAGVEE